MTSRPHRSHRPYRPTARVAARVAAGAAVGVVGLVGSAQLSGLTGAEASGAHARDRPVIVEVAGDAANGFALTYDDGARAFPPTWSEALAECSEHQTRVARVRCRVGVRTWYRDLGDLRRSIMFTQEHVG